MRKLQSDLTVLYTKLHTLHYNVEGPDFYNVHVMLEKQYDMVHEWIDEVAESVMIDGKNRPFGTLKEMISYSQIEEIESKPYKSKEVFAIVLADFETLLEYITAESETFPLNQNGMDTIDSMRAYLEKQIWFIKSSMK